MRWARGDVSGLFPVRLSEERERQLHGDVRGSRGAFSRMVILKAFGSASGELNLRS